MAIRQCFTVSVIQNPPEPKDWVGMVEGVLQEKTDWVVRGTFLTLTYFATILEIVVVHP